MKFLYYILEDHANKDQLKFSHMKQLQILWLKNTFIFLHPYTEACELLLVQPTS